jgi:5-methylcytosine-specific restriction protein A
MPTVHKTKRPWVKEAPKSTARWSNEAKGGMPVKFYHSPAWRKLRAQILQESPLCVHCQKNNQLIPATVVDHIKPIRLGGEPLDPANLTPLCKRHHQSKSGKERHM